MKTVEDCLEALFNFNNTNFNFSIDSSDYNILSSLARQVFRQTPLTDRQYELSIKKCVEYKEQFVDNNILNVEEAVQNLRMPLRELDRSRWIKLADYKDQVTYIAVRFIFNKKLISAIESIRVNDPHAEYDKKNKIHYFSYNEKNLYNIVNLLKNKNFDIDEDILEKYELIKDMENNKDKHIPGIYGFKLQNLNSKAFDYIVSDIGLPDKDSLALFKDRQQMYALEHFDEDVLDQSINQLTTLSQKIVRRNHSTIFINNKEYSFNTIAESFLELFRFPLLIILDKDNDFDNLIESYNTFKYILSDESFSVMYRKENSTADNQKFNNYIKSFNLNNTLDNNPKVVYINKDKFPKTLLKTPWKPIAAIMFGSTRMTNTKLQSYLNDIDLVIHYDSDISPFIRNNIEKI